MKISIIVPVYNAELTIKKCIDSIINQIDDNFELIIINDASNDNTKLVLNKYIDNPLIKIINNKDNMGIGYSRNIGIKCARYDYISFIDSDDYIEPNMFKVLKENILDNDLIIFNYNKIVKNEIYKNEYNFSNREVNFKNNPDILLDINLSPWNKLYKKSLLIDNYFPENLKYEDAIVVVKAFLNAKKIKIINDKLYNYVVRNNSETTIIDEKVFDILKISDLIIKELKGKISTNCLEAFMIRNLFRYTIQQKYQKNKKLKYKFVDDAFTFLDTNFPSWKKNKIYNKRSFIKKIIEKNKLLTKIYISL